MSHMKPSQSQTTHIIKNLCREKKNQYGKVTLKRRKKEKKERKTKTI